MAYRQSAVIYTKRLQALDNMGFIYELLSRIFTVSFSIDLWLISASLV